MESKSEKIYKNIMIIMFLLFIAVVVIYNIITPVKKFSEAENRYLQQKPHFSFDRLVSGQFTRDFEKYIADQFPSRDGWIAVKAYSEKVSGKKENNNIYIGKDGYMFQKFAEHDENETRDKINAINSFAGELVAVNKYFMLVPNSVEILKEKVPGYAPNADEKKFISKVKKGLSKDIKFIDVYDTLYSKRNENIYYKTDHHWTTKGAYYAYTSFAKALGIKPQGSDDYNINKVTDSFYGTSYSTGGFRSIKPDSIELYVPKQNEKYEVTFSENGKKSDSLYNMDSLKQKDKYNVFLNGNHPLVTIKTNSSSKKKILIIKDSYANSFVPYLTSQFSEVYLVDLRYYDDDIIELIKNNNIDNVLILYNGITFSEDSSISSIYSN